MAMFNIADPKLIGGGILRAAVSPWRRPLSYSPTQGDNVIVLDVEHRLLSTWIRTAVYPAPYSTHQKAILSCTRPESQQRGGKALRCGRKCIRLCSFPEFRTQIYLVLNPCCLFYTMCVPTGDCLLPNRTCVPYIQEKDMIGSTCFRIAWVYHRYIYLSSLV